MQKVRINLDAENGNAFNLLGAFAAKAREQGWHDNEIKLVRDEATTGDYQHLLKTLIDYTELEPA